MRKIELLIESIIFQSRWLLAPFYLGLAFCLLLLLFHFGVQVYEFVVNEHERQVGKEQLLGYQNAKRKLN